MIEELEKIGQGHGLEANGRSKSWLYLSKSVFMLANSWSFYMQWMQMKSTLKFTFNLDEAESYQTSHNYQLLTLILLNCSQKII